MYIQYQDYDLKIERDQKTCQKTCRFTLSPFLVLDRNMDSPLPKKDEETSKTKEENMKNENALNESPKVLIFNN